MGDSYYRFFPGDYMRDTAGLSLVEDGAYRRMLDHYYSEESLPSDPGRLFRICRAFTEEERKAVLFVAGKYFTDGGGTLVNARAEREIALRREFLAEQSRKGKLSAEKRWGYRQKEAGGITAVVTAVVTEGQPDCNLPSPSPLKDQNLLSEPAVSDGSDIDAKEPSRSRKRISYPDAFTEFWSAYPRPVGKTAAYEAWVKITKDGYPPEDILRATEEFARQMEREKREESKIRHPERFLKKDFWKEFCLAD
jgi:uncharacterized protein YdaU (DUF1376 family)